MKRQIAVSLAILLCCVFLFAGDYTDDFNRASLGSNWTVTTNCTIPSIISNQLSFGSGHYSAYWNANAVGADQYSQMTIVTLGSGGPAVRISASAETMYVGHVDSSTIAKINKWTAGSEAALGATIAGTYAPGDIIKIEATGTTTTTLKLYQNGNLIGTRDDSSSPITSGQPGAWSYGGVYDDWAAGDISAPPATHPRFIGLTGVAH